MSTLIQDQRLISKIGFSEILKRHVRVLELSVSIILHDCSRSFIDPVQLKSDDFGMHYVLRKNFFFVLLFFSKPRRPNEPIRYYILFGSYRKSTIIIHVHRLNEHTVVLQ